MFIRGDASLVYDSLVVNSKTRRDLCREKKHAQFYNSPPTSVKALVGANVFTHGGRIH